jgi:type II secretory pathway pseudopilin PulG
VTKKAFTLVEILAVLVTIPVVLLLGSRIFVAVVRDVPKDVRLLQQNALVLDITRCIAEDMDRAEGLPQSTGTFSSDPQTLLIQLPEAVACYQQSGETVTRTVIGREEGPETWDVPDATIAWQRW